MLKKKYFLILLIVCISLFTPLLANAEDVFSEYYGVSLGINDYMSMDLQPYDYYFSNEVIYENGQYILSGFVTNNLYNGHVIRPEFTETIYTCSSEVDTTCQNVTLIYRNMDFIGFHQGLLGLVLKNGETAEQRRHFYVGKDYEYMNDHYNLVNYEEHDISELKKANDLSQKFHEYYYCPGTGGISCDNMVVLLSVGNYFSYGASVEDWHFIGEGYQYNNGKYKLVNPKKTLLATAHGGSGYTCISKEDICDEVYYVEISDYYEFRDGGREYTYSKVMAPNEVILNTIDLKVKNTKSLAEYFTPNELNNIIITDSSIIDIEDGYIICKAAGETSLIYESNGLYKELTITVTENQIEKPKMQPLDNPNTSSKVPIFLTIFIVIIVFLLWIQHKEIIKKIKLNNMND